MPATAYALTVLILWFRGVIFREAVDAGPLGAFSRVGCGLYQGLCNEALTG